ncbi:SLATT domain-containing protein [Flavobacterium psychrophilum]|nr:SLATT domain-containing protein [Flavobacterium psychrophilum]
MNDKLLANTRHYFAQSVFNTSCHYNANTRLLKKKKQLSNIVVSFSAITLIVLILQVVGLENKNQSLLNILAYIGMLITGVSLIFEMYNKDDKSHEIFQHKVYAEKYKTLRDEYMSLIEEIMSNSTTETELRIKKDNLQKRYSAIGENSPETTSEDYKQAQIGLGLNGNSGEEFTWADKEIDIFLPEQLRLKK